MVHVTTGAGLFVIILLITFGLNSLIHLLDGKVHWIVIILLKCAEISVLVIDIFYIVLFLFISSVKSLRCFWNS